MSADEIMNELKQIAVDENFDIDLDVAERIARFRVRRNIPMTICPCDPQSKMRGCIGPLCHIEIQKNGVCHCNIFKRKEN